MLRFFKSEKLKCSATRSCLTLFLILLIIGNFICLKLFLDSIKKEEKLKVVKNNEGFVTFKTMPDSITKTNSEKQAFELPNEVKVNYVDKQEEEEADKLRQLEETKNNEESEDDEDKEDENDFNPQQNDYRHKHHERKGQ